MTTHDEKLSALWKEGARDFALAFFKRAIHADLTLAELAATLQFDSVQSELAHITMRQVMAVPSAAPAAEPREAPKVKESKLEEASRGQRRDKRQTEKIKSAFIELLRNVNAGLSTPGLSDSLQRAGFSIDTATANLILKNMENAGLIVGDSGRPRTWRLKNQGRQNAEPIVIRKAQDRTAEAPQPATPAPSSTLLSQAEIQSAANVLRERFFASKNNA